MPEIEAPVQPLTADTQTATAADESSSQTVPDAAPEQTTAEAKAGAEEIPVPPWVAVTELEGLREHVQPFLEEAERTGYEKRSSEFAEFAAPFLQQRAKIMNDVNAGIGRVLKDLRDLAKSDSVDADSLAGWLGEHEETFKALSGELSEPWQFHGAKRLLVSLAEATGDSSLATPFVNRLNMVEAAIPDPSLFKDFVKKLSDKAVAEGKQPLQTKVSALESEVEQLKARLREKGGGPDLETKTATGGRTDDQLLLDNNTPVEQLVQIRARQKMVGG